MLKKAGVVQPGASGAFLAAGKRRGVNGADLGGDWRFGVRRLQVGCLELRENAEYLVWYFKKPVFTKKKISKEVSKLSPECCSSSM